MTRHLAYFDFDSGAALAEAQVPARATWMLALANRLGWTWLRNRWVSQLARQGLEALPSFGGVRIIALDVTPFGYPLGDFRWARYDAGSNQLDFPESHCFVEINRLDPSAPYIEAVVKSARPVRSNARHLIVDVTGTALEAAATSGHLLGARLIQRNGQWSLEASDSAAALPPAHDDPLWTAAVEQMRAPQKAQVLVA